MNLLNCYSSLYEPLLGEYRPSVFFVQTLLRRFVLSRPRADIVQIQRSLLVNNWLIIVDPEFGENMPGRPCLTERRPMVIALTSILITTDCKMSKCYCLRRLKNEN